MKRVNILAVGTALILIAAPLAAQLIQPAPTETSGKAFVLDVPSRTTAPGPGRSKALSGFDEMQVNELVGESVYNTGGENMGKIEDIVVNKGDHTVAALVGMGEFLGVDVRQVAVLLSELEIQGYKIVVKNLTRTDFQRMIAYRTSDWASHDRDRLIGAGR